MNGHGVDRQIIAQALAETVPVVTPDEVFNFYEASRSYDDWMREHRLITVGVECYAGHRGEQTPRTLILGERRMAVTEVVDAWLAPDYRYFKLRGADGHSYLVRHDERSNTWELTMFPAEHVGG